MGALALEFGLPQSSKHAAYALPMCSSPRPCVDYPEKSHSTHVETNLCEGIESKKRNAATCTLEMRYNWRRREPTGGLQEAACFFAFYDDLI
ncbi:hypothetical protein CVT25_001447 [Psilocybe cyanescens]|uniref:Uncharacterized protein n=1 Tax=Psilocybe cyanescens TaxID=93625 RepID=A0A409WNR1_PSICY|nr:hypothetical protein CVT25_001447 [Psilocybe cyanescens]